MAEMRQRLVISTVIPLLLLLSGIVLAQEVPSECVEMGGMAYDNWTKSDSGGSGMPAGEADNDYIRCKACHGWDKMGTEGGYVRRDRKDGRPNAGAGDSDTTSRVISPFMGSHDPITEDMISHAGTGRAFTDGTGSWVPLDETHSAANKAANAEGFTLGNQHPDLSADGANAGDTVLTAEQLGCLVEFLNFADADPAAYFAAINPSVKPVLYTIIGTADAEAGETFYDANCDGCHSDPAGESTVGAPDGGILAYLAQDGKFSEFSHKTRWGIPDTSMSRDAMGDPTSADVANMMLWLQELGETGFALNPGLTGTWWNAMRDGEGFVLQFGYVPGTTTLTLFASFYTYDDMGNQVWLVALPTAGSVPASGDSVDVTVYQVTGPMWGADFDPADANRVIWGTGTFTFPSCTSGSVSLMPGDDAMAEGFTDLAYSLTREDFLGTATACPTPTAN
jgi:cytochrome c2